MRLALLAVLAACSGGDMSPGPNTLSIHLPHWQVTLEHGDLVVADAAGTIQTRHVDLPGDYRVDIDGEASATLILTNDQKIFRIDTKFALEAGDEVTLLEDLKQPMEGVTVSYPPDPGASGYRVTSRCAGAHDAQLYPFCEPSRMDIVVTSQSSQGGALHYMEASGINADPGDKITFQGPWSDLVAYGDTYDLQPSGVSREVPANSGISYPNRGPLSDTASTYFPVREGALLHLYLEVFNGRETRHHFNLASTTPGDVTDVAFDAATQTILAHTTTLNEIDATTYELRYGGAGSPIITWYLRGPSPSNSDISVALPPITPMLLPQMPCHGGSDTGQCSVSVGLWSSTEVDGYNDLRTAPGRIDPLLRLPMPLGAKIHSVIASGTF